MREAWQQGTGAALPRRSVDVAAVVTMSGTSMGDRLFHAAITEVLDCGSTLPTHGRHTAGTISPPRAADPAIAPLTLRQLLAEQGVVVLGLVLQPKLIYRDQPSLAMLPVEPDAPTDDGAVSADRAERSAIHLVFRARMAAARICLPKGALGIALRALHREGRACLQALQDRIAARHAVQMHGRSAKNFRRTVALTALGVPERPTSEIIDDMNARVRASILNTLGE